MHVENVLGILGIKRWVGRRSLLVTLGRTYPSSPFRWCRPGPHRVTVRYRALGQRKLAGQGRIGGGSRTAFVGGPVDAFFGVIWSATKFSGGSGEFRLLIEPQLLQTHSYLVFYQQTDLPYNTSVFRGAREAIIAKNYRDEDGGRMF